MKLRSLAAAALLGAFAVSARADYLIPQPTSGPTVTVSAFSCLVGKVCPTHVNVNSAGTEVGTAAAPLRVDPTGTTTQPVNCVTGCSGSGSTFGAAFPSTGGAIGMSVGGNLVALTGAGGNLNVQCANCSGSGVSAIDESAFAPSSGVFALGGGFFQTTATSNPLASGQQGAFQVTAQRALFANLRNSSGTEVGTSTTPLQVSLANTGLNSTALLVTGAGTGTFPATQSGTWTVQPGNTANTTPWLATINQGGNSATVSAGGALKVDGSASTQPVSGTVTANQGGAWTVAATQSGTWNVSQATASNLNAAVVGVGSAGTASGGVLTVQGAASMTPLLVTPAANSSVNLAQVNGVTTLAGAGASGTGAQRVTVSQDSTTLAGAAPGTAGAASANVVTVQGVALMTPVQVSQATAASLNATVVGNGTFAVQAAQSGAWAASLGAAATGGCMPGHFLSAASNNATSVKNSAGTLCSLTVVQTTTTTGDLRLYDSAAAPTCSSAAGVVQNYAVQSNAISPGFSIPIGPYGMAFVNGIGVCLTGNVADNDNTNFATGVQVNYAFK